MKRDRIFFFANYEGLRVRQGITIIARVPDEDARRGLLRNPATGALEPVTVNPAAKPYVDLFPLPNGRSFGDGSAEHVGDLSSPANEDYSMHRVDFNLSEKDSLYWRYTYSTSNSQEPLATLPFWDGGDIGTQFALLSATRVISPSSLNEFRFAFNRTNPAYISGPE